MLRPVPCSAFSEPSYLSTISSTSPRHERLVAVAVGGLGQRRGQQEVQVARRWRGPRRRSESRARRAAPGCRARIRRCAPAGTHTSSMRSAVPCGRIAPTMPCMPSRTSQKTSVSWRSRVNAASSSRSQPATRGQRALLQAVELRLVGGAQLDEQHGALGRDLAPRLGHARQRVGGGDQRRVDHQLDGGRAGLDQRGDRRGGGVDVLEEQQARRRVAPVRHGLELGLGDEGQRALRADDQPSRRSRAGSSASRNAHSR